MWLLKYNKIIGTATILVEKIRSGDKSVQIIIEVRLLCNSRLHAGGKYFITVQG